MASAVVLVAGASTRSGPTPKALLPVDAGVTVLRTLLATAAEAGIGEVLVVTGAHAESVVKELEGTGARVVPNLRWERGRTGSVQAGFRALREHEAPTLLWPVDHPFVLPGTLRALLAAAGASPGGSRRASWTVPSCSGHRGHPVVLAKEAREEVLGYPEDEPLSRYLRTHPEQVQEVVVTDTGVLENIDTPEAFETARARWLREGPPARARRG